MHNRYAFGTHFRSAMHADCPNVGRAWTFTFRSRHMRRRFVLLLVFRGGTRTGSGLDSRLVAPNFFSVITHLLFSGTGVTTRTNNSDEGSCTLTVCDMCLDFSEFKSRKHCWKSIRAWLLDVCAVHSRTHHTHAMPQFVRHNHNILSYM